MPNLRAKIGKGMICFCRGAYAKKSDILLAQDILRPAGKTLLIPESLMNAATAISGSGPGFLFFLLQGFLELNGLLSASRFFAPGLRKAAQSVGFTAYQAGVLAAATNGGSISLLAAALLSPEKLCSQVASKGGTTEAGLTQLRRGGSLLDAVQAAVQRAKELSKQ